MNNEKTIWNYFKGKGLNDFGIAGLMGNLYAESGLLSNNLQNTGNTKLGMTDDEYVAAVDSGSYQGFVKDSQGFGLAQWTFWSRKQNLLDFARAAGKSIGDLQMQLDFLWKELFESYASVLQTLKTASSILEASNSVLLKFERPADQSESVQAKRASFGQVYYDKYAGKQTDEISADDFAKLFAKMRSKLQTNDCNSYSAEARQWAVSRGLIAGNGTLINYEPNYMWSDFVTREQLVVVLYRFAQM